MSPPSSSRQSSLSMKGLEDGLSNQVGQHQSRPGFQGSRRRTRAVCLSLRGRPELTNHNLTSSSWDRKEKPLWGGLYKIPNCGILDSSGDWPKNAGLDFTPTYTNVFGWFVWSWWLWSVLGSRSSKAKVQLQCSRFTNGTERRFVSRRSTSAHPRQAAFTAGEGRGQRGAARAVQGRTSPARQSSGAQPLRCARTGCI